MDELWSVLDGGRCQITDFPNDRPADSGYPGSRGGYVDRVQDFDARFFGMSDREALRTDPRHRLLLEVAWEAVEDAGLPVERLASDRTGVYVAGGFGSEYWDLLRANGIIDLHAAYGAGMLGTAPARLARLLDARGPNVAVDATCAGSLLATHLAMRALRNGEIDAALVAGVNLMISGDFSASLASGGVLSAGGLCRFGDALADGYVRSEGAVAVLLKRLPDAQAAGDRVHAVLLGSATSSDGRTESAMTPSAAGQQAALRQAYRDAGVAASSVQYIEAHGTGTVVGDRIELSALAEVISEGRQPENPCLVGSVKSNVGHTEAAAGLTGLLKVVLSLQHRVIPATLHVSTPNPVLAQHPNLRLAQSRVAWPSSDRPLAGLTSLGLSGVNVHVVVGAGPPAAPIEVPDRPVLIPLSAHNESALREFARRCIDTGLTPAQLAHATGQGRSHHRLRDAVMVRTPSELAESLNAVRGTATSNSGPPRLVFVFPGQGGQWAGMAADLCEAEPVFALRMAECDAAIKAELGWSVRELLRARAELNTVDCVQPALWAVQVSLAAVWRSWGIEPDLVIGHSMGEIAAATVAGALTVQDGAAVVCRRARLLRWSAHGAMLAVQLGEADLAASLRRHGSNVAVGVINSRQSTVLSGTAQAVSEIAAELTQRGVFCRQVNVDYASHCSLVDPLGDRLVPALAGLRAGPAAIPMRSTALDRLVTGQELDAEYWMANLRLPVRFASSVRAALAPDRRTLFVEINPHPVLIAALEEEIEVAGAAAAAVSSLHRGEDWTVLLKAAGVAYRMGAEPDWSRINPATGFARAPGYPWQRKQYWIGSGNSTPTGRSAKDTVMRDHTGQGNWVDAVVTSLRELNPCTSVELGGLRRYRQVEAADPLRLLLQPGAAGRWNFEVLSRPAGGDSSQLWSAVASGWGVRASEPLAPHGHDRLPVQGLSELAATKLVASRLELSELELAAGLGHCVESLITRLAAEGDTSDVTVRFHGPAACRCSRAVIASGDQTTLLILDEDGAVLAEFPDAGRPVEDQVDIRAAGTPDQAAIRALTAEVLGTGSEDLDPDLPLVALGLDSLLAAELRARLRSELGVECSLPSMLGGISLRMVAS